jgi:hypothetical protein
VPQEPRMLKVIAGITEQRGSRRKRTRKREQNRQQKAASKGKPMAPRGAGVGATRGCGTAPW